MAPTMRWEGYVQLAFAEVCQAGAGSLQVSRRLTAALDDLLVVATPSRRPVLEQQLAQLEDLTRSATPREGDRAAALFADPVGIGSSEDLLTADGSEAPTGRDGAAASGSGPGRA